MKNNMLAAIRKQRGLTQSAVAKKALISEVNYQRIEYGTQRPSVDTAIRIADALQVKTYREFKELFGAADAHNARGNN